MYSIRNFGLLRCRPHKFGLRDQIEIVQLNCDIVRVWVDSVHSVFVPVRIQLRFLSHMVLILWKRWICEHEDNTILFLTKWFANNFAFLFLQNKRNCSTGWNKTKPNFGDWYQFWLNVPCPGSCVSGSRKQRFLMFSPNNFETRREPGANGCELPEDVSSFKFQVSGCFRLFHVVSCWEKIGVEVFAWKLNWGSVVYIMCWYLKDRDCVKYV